MIPIITTITPSWQIYLPEGIRRAMKLTKPSRAKISVRNKKIVVEPIKSEIFKAAGSLAGVKPTVQIDIDNVRDYVDYSQW